jgi:hypothetical protein
MFSNLLFIILISDIFLDPFIKVVILFNFILQHEFVFIFYVYFDPRSFSFFGPFLN